MTLITTVTATPAHNCRVPARAGHGAGTVWQCDCGVKWGVRNSLSHDAPYLDWRKLSPAGAPLSFLNVNRFPVLREPEPAV